MTKKYILCCASTSEEVARSQSFMGLPSRLGAVEYTNYFSADG